MIILLVNSLGTWLIYYLLRGIVGLESGDAAILVLAASFAVYWRGLFVYRYLMSWLNQFVFGLIYINAAHLHNHFIDEYIAAISYALFAVTAAFSLVLRKPFTLQYARQSVTSDRWSNPLFLKINDEISAVWTAVFLVNAAINFAPNQAFQNSFSRLISITLTSLAVIFTAEYPTLAVKKSKKTRSC